jgi:hypothetical protein
VDVHGLVDGNVRVAHGRSDPPVVWEYKITNCRLAQGFDAPVKFLGGPIDSTISGRLFRTSEPQRAALRIAIDTDTWKPGSYDLSAFTDRDDASLSQPMGLDVKANQNLAWGISIAAALVGSIILALRAAASTQVAWKDLPRAIASYFSLPNVLPILAGWAAACVLLNQKVIQNDRWYASISQYGALASSIFAVLTATGTGVVAISGRGASVQDQTDERASRDEPRR